MKTQFHEHPEKTYMRVSKSQIHKHPKKTYMRVSKTLFFLAAIIAASLISTKSYSQVYVGARFGHVGVGFPVYHRPYLRGPVVYGGAYIAPVPAPVYAPAPAVIDYNDFPGYAYYNYPAWYGHFRDRVYYEHYRPMFMRSHAYYRGGYRGRRW